MANYFVTNTARFNPFTYQEVLAPIVEATKQQYALEEAVSSMDDGTIASYLAGESKDSPYVSDYKKLSKRIEDLSQQLAANGISPNLMRDALRLKGDFKKFSTPVEAAGKRKQQLSDEYRKLQLSVPYLIGENPSEKPLQFYIDNPNYTPKYDNGEAYINQGTLIGKQLADQLRNPNAPYTVVPGSGGAFLRAVYRRGYTPEEIANDPMFVNITNQILQSRGVDPSGNDARTNAIRSYIQQGLFSSLGKDEVDMRNNPNHLNPLEQLKYNALKNPPENPEGPKSTQYDSIKYVGNKNDWATSILENSDLRQFKSPILDSEGNQLNNQLDVYRYLRRLEENVDRLKSKKGNSLYDYDKEYADAYQLVKREKYRLSPYTMSNKDYRELKNNLGFDNDSFTYDDISNKITTTRSKFGSRQIPLYSLASKANSDENFERYMTSLAENLSNYGEKKGYFFVTDGVNLGKTITGSQLSKALLDNKPSRVATDVPLMFSENGGHYAMIVTDKGKYAVPLEIFGDLTLPLQSFAYGTYNDNTLRDVDEYYRNRGKNLDFTGSIFDMDTDNNTFNDIMTYFNNIIDARTRESRRIGQGQKELEISSSKGDF
jgi:hypothetical protein